MRRSKVPGPARSSVNSTARRRGEAEPSPTTPHAVDVEEINSRSFTQSLLGGAAEPRRLEVVG